MTDLEFPAYLSGCAIYQNEARYLAEWLEFHRLVGFEKFYLYDNRSTDEHREVLEPYVQEGFVEIKDWPVSPGQIPAYQDCLSWAKHQTRWLAFFDIDEFCFSPLGRPLPEVLWEYEAHPGLGVNLVVFGTSGFVEPPEGPVIEHYVLREREARNLVKSIVDPRRAVECLGAHFFRYMQCIWPRIWAEVNAADEQHREFPRAMSESASIEKLRINHYYFKSEQEVTEKFKRAKADGSGLRPAKILEQVKYANLLEDRDIQMYLPFLREALMLDPPLVESPDQSAR